MLPVQVLLTLRWSAPRESVMCMHLTKDFQSEKALLNSMEVLLPAVGTLYWMRYQLALSAVLYAFERSNELLVGT